MRYVNSNVGGKLPSAHTAITPPAPGIAKTPQIIPRPKRTACLPDRHSLPQPTQTAAAGPYGLSHRQRTPQPAVSVITGLPKAQMSAVV